MGATTCHLCLAEPDDWCPACMSFLCPDHAHWHRGDFDTPCRQIGPELDYGWVQHCIPLTADELDAAGVGIGRLGTTDEGHRAAFRCPDCRRMFTVTGPPSMNYGIGCLAEGCESYDIDRDVDLFFDAAFEAGIIRRSPGDDGTEAQA